MKNTMTRILLAVSVCTFVLLMSGCKEGAGYTHGWMHREDVSTVYVEMFDSSSFRRGHEYDLTDAICKRIEAETPYKIVSDRDVADTILSGRIYAIRQTVLNTERYTGRPMEREIQVDVVVTWKNILTGELLVDNKSVSASASYSTQLVPAQTIEYAILLAVNRTGERVVELMQQPW